VIAIDHTGKGVLVTGAGAGIGREIACWFARAGAAVAVADVRADKAGETVAAIEAEGGRAVAVVKDLRDDAEIPAMVDEAVAGLGRLDVAVNNVGNFPPGRMPTPAVEMDGAFWRDLLDQNLVMAALCAAAEARAGAEVILFVSSGETTRPSPGMAAYAAAKAGLNHLVATLAVELGPKRVLAIAPGTTLTETVAAALPEDYVARIVESTPLKRAVEFDELARLAVFLGSDLARCITGQLILADAGAFLSRNRPPLG
jgi:NAD(P)-dependent dehydrogenase (short-subunit alcohol dehydrogenase family)